MNAVRLAIFVAVLAAVVAGGTALGAAVDPDPRRGDERGHDDVSTHDTPTTNETATTNDPRGLAVADDGLRLVADRTELPAGDAAPFRFLIVDARDRAVTDFEVEHEREMHLIAVRRDMRDYQHVHPRLTEDGTWEVDLRLSDPGSYRVFADFNRGGESHTLGTDVSVPGRFDPRPLPEPSERASTEDGYQVRLAGDGAELRFTVEKDGRELEDIEPYLGARGHLVALREGDLAYLHVHPESDATEGRDIRFAVEYPSEGRYRLFLQFKHDGRVHTAAFTREKGEAGDAHGH
jgi:hypothetical protein